jgi:ribosomal protein L15E
VFIGHDRAREVIVVADEQVPVSEGLIVHREFGAPELTLVPDSTVPEDSGQRWHGVVEVDDTHEETAKGVSLRAVVTEEYVVVLEGGDGPAVETAMHNVARPAPATETERVAIPVMRQVSTIVFVLEAVAGRKSPGLGVVLSVWLGRKSGHCWVASKLVASDPW